VLRAKAPVRVSYDGGFVSALNTEALLDADLISKHQKVNLHSKAFVQVDQGFHHAGVNVKTRIEHLELELPPFEPIAGVPKLVRDSRIKLKPAKPAKVSAAKFSVTLDLSVETAGPGAVKLYSELAKPFVPLEFKVEEHSPGAPTGQVRVLPFTVEYLRRKLAVDSLTLGLGEASTHEFPLSGDFHVDQTDYKVMIHVGGTTGSPQIQLSSDPYLERADVISVLLYDRTSDELSSGDAETVGNVQGALADKAIGLFGLWLFAATPIRSFTYNPVTKVYSASVSLGGGLTASVGTNWEQSAMLEVRKRISRRWVVTATYSPSEDDPERKIGKLTLQWERRF
jgi:hypothetical protein